jgi:hypothetical protein
MSRPNPCRAALIAVGAALLIQLGGCIAVGGNDRFTTPTLGQQLKDLKSARDCGAVSDSEYKQAKEDLLCGRISGAAGN